MRTFPDVDFTGPVVFAIAIEWDASNSSVFTSGPWPTPPGVNNAPAAFGTVRHPETLTTRITSVSQDIKPGSFSSSIGSFSFDVMDPSGDIAADLNTRPSLGRQRVRFYASTTEGAWVTVGTWVLERVDWDRAAGVFRIKCGSWLSVARDKVFRLGVTQVDFTQTLSIGPNSTAFFVTDDSQLSMHETSAQHSRGASVARGYLDIDGEIAEFTGVSGGVISGLSRGLLDTPRTTYTYVAGEEPPDVQEVIWGEEFATDWISLVFTGLRKDGSDPGWPARWHLGLDLDEVFEVDSLTVPDDVVLRFYLRDEASAMTWLESNVLPLLGSVLVETSEGKLRLKKLSNLQGGSTLTLTEDNVERMTPVGSDTLNIANRFKIGWNGDVEGNTTRSFRIVDTDSAALYGQSDLTTLDFPGLHGSTATARVLSQLGDLLTQRRTKAELQTTATVLAPGMEVEVGDSVDVQLDLPDFANTPTRGSYEVRKVTIDFLRRTAQLKLAKFTAEPGAVTGGGTCTTAMADSWYTSAGTAIAPGTLGADTTIGPGTFYVDGDWTIPIGVTLTLVGHVELRIRGFFTLNGTIDGTGGGPAGQTTPGDSGSFAHMGDNRARDSLLLDFFGGSGENIRSGVVTRGRHERLPPLILENTDGTTLGGLPSDTRGSSGGAPLPLRLIDADALDGSFLGTTDYSTVGVGGDGGAGLVLICRGIDMGSVGQVTLDGDPGTDGSVVIVLGSQITQRFRLPGGAGGCGGGFYLLLDGTAATATNVRFSSADGLPGQPCEPVSGQPLTATVSRALLASPARELGPARYQIQYLPCPLAPQEDPSPPFSGRADPGYTFATIVEDVGGVYDFTAFEGQYPDSQVRVFGADGIDYSAEATFSVGSSPANASVTIDPVTGDWDVTALTGTATVTWNATIRGVTLSATTILQRLTNGAVSAGA